MAHLPSNPVLPHPLAVQHLSQVLITIELRNILHCLYSQDLVFLKVEDILQSFSQALIHLESIDLISFKQILNFLEFKYLGSELDPSFLNYRI